MTQSIPQTLPELPHPKALLDTGGGWMAPTGGFTADQMREYAWAALAASQEVTAGWKRVPLEPTREMIDAYLKADGRFHSARSDWAAMVAAAPQPQKKPGLTVSVCHLSDGDDPFVFECHGRVTASALASIDKALLENRDTHFPDGPGDYEFSLTWYKGQYGFEGRCELAPGWEFEQTGFKPMPAPPSQGAKE
jgi:hypothetical protein